MDLENHPCFNAKVRHKFGRIHLPVAPRCNVQCNFCSRKYDCVNESRPGVTSGVLAPDMALAYLRQVIEQRQDISVVGIAGPGDPFANPDETLETLALVRAAYPEMLLCVATNGLNLARHIPALAQLKLSHVTVTVNAVDPHIGAKIYGWIRYEKRIHRGEAAAQYLLENQLNAIAEMKALGMMVKVNTVIVPGINAEHASAVAEKMAALKVDILNCIPFYAVEGAAFANIPEPDAGMILKIRKNVRQYIPQMKHCARCRADAVGLLGENSVPDLKNIPINPPISTSITLSRPYLAVTSREGMLINQHLGEAEQVYIYAKMPGGNMDLISIRPTPLRGGGDQRWKQLSEILGDCHTLLVNGVGPSPRKTLTESGLQVLEVEGLISNAFYALENGQTLSHLFKREAFACGTSCSGSGGGCG
jgi:nitrogen fixation protein NifB